MPPKRRRRFQGLYYHSSPPKVIPMNGDMANQSNKKRRDIDDLSVKLSTIRIWMHEKDITKLTRILWAGQGNRLCQQASRNARMKRFLAAVPYVMNAIKEVHQAVIDNNLETLQAKLEPPVPQALVTCKDANGLNIIHKAAGLGHTKILEYLIGLWPEGAHETDITGKTALHWAASAKNNMRSYSLLTQGGCDEEAVDYKMKSPSYYRHKPHEIERAFLVYVPEAPRVSPDVATDWEALNDDTSDLKKLEAKVSPTNGLSSVATDESIEPTSDLDLNYGTNTSGEHAISKDTEPYQLHDNNTAESQQESESNDIYINDKEENLENTEIELDEDQQSNKNDEAKEDNEDNGAEDKETEVKVEDEDQAADEFEEQKTHTNALSDSADAQKNVTAEDLDGSDTVNDVKFEEEENEVEILPSNEQENVVPDLETVEIIEDNNEIEESEMEITVEPNETESDRNEQENVVPDLETVEIIEDNNEIEESEIEVTGEPNETESDINESAEQNGGDPQNLEDILDHLLEETVDENNEEQMNNKEESEGVNSHLDNGTESDAELVQQANVKIDEENVTEDQLDSEIFHNIEKEQENGEEKENETAQTDARVGTGIIIEEFMEDKAENPKKPDEDEEKDDDEDEGNAVGEDLINVNDDQETANDGYDTEDTPTSSLAIEGFIQGEPEDNTVQSQVAAYIDEETSIEQAIASGDMEQLAQIVLNGNGSKLLSMQSKEADIQAFLDNVPNYMTKINRVHQAAREGNLLSLQQALDRRKFAIAKDEISPDGATPLHIAVLFGHSDIVRYLATRFPETTIQTDNNGRTALHYAATIKDNGHFYNMLLQNGANPKIFDKLGHTPEFYLDSEKSKTLLTYRQLLAAFGAENLEEELLNDQGQVEDQTFEANSIFKTEQGKYLADTLADPLISALTEIANKRPVDPLAFLASYLQKYINNNTNANNKNYNEHIEYNGEKPHSSSNQTSSTAVVDSLADRKYQIKNSNFDDIELDGLSLDDDDELTNNSYDDRDEHGQSMLHFACARSHRRGGLINIIEESKINLTYRDELYRTARDVSLQANQPMNAKEIDRYLLSIAVTGDLKYFEHLAIEGYDHIGDIVDDAGTSIIDIVVDRGFEELADFLRNLRSLEETREELHYMIRSKNVDRIKEITASSNAKWFLKAKNYYGRTALHIAILKEAEQIVEHFLKLTPDILKIGDNLERTPLHYAMGTDAIESLSRILIQKGAKRTSKDLKGRQPSYYFMNKADILRIQEEEEANR